MLTKDQHDQLRELAYRRDQSLYSFQRHLISVSATVLGITIALHSQAKNNLPNKQATVLYIIAILGMTLGTLFLAIANHEETDLMRKAQKATVESWIKEKTIVATPSRYYTWAEIAGYLLLSIGLISLAGFAVFSELD